MKFIGVSYANAKFGYGHLSYDVEYSGLRAGEDYRQAKGN